MSAMTNTPGDVERELRALPVRTEILNVDTGETGTQSIVLPLELRDRILATLTTSGRITPEWCLRMAELEGDAEIGAGSPDHPLRTGIVPSSNAAGGDEVPRRVRDAYDHFRNMTDSEFAAIATSDDGEQLLGLIVGSLGDAVDALSITGGDSRG
jgi:hypothetical protein